MLGISFCFTTCKKNEVISDESVFVDPRDGNSYKTVRIGDQLWFAENLRYLPKMVPLQWYTYDNPFYAIGSYKESSVAEAVETSYYKKYGVSYNWRAAQSACPPGWHIPSPEEWEKLISYCGGWDIAGSILKSADTLYWNRTPKQTTNEFGFSILPGGTGPLIQDTCTRACFWNSRDTIEMDNCVIGVLFLDEVVRASKFYSPNRTQQGTLSIRCIKD